MRNAVCCRLAFGATLEGKLILVTCGTPDTFAVVYQFSSPRKFEEAFQLKEHKSGVRAVRVSPDGEIIATVCLLLWLSLCM